VRELIMQDRHVTYIEIAASLRIYSTSIHSLLHEHLAVIQRNLFVEEVLLLVFGEFRKTIKRRRVTVHHDNASSHTLAQCSSFLTGQNDELMGHPPYSTVLAPNDFPHIRTRMRSQRFSTPEDAVEAFKNRVLEVYQSE